ncbi:MAG: phosphatidate cytidylyltransferase [Pirellulaceae bacterium]|nr:phosphatidate cytidylyltransferase [Planctomycetales bacterium]MCA9210971.1 phosphatidate cytidylyltransferase [Planctomycetales bacterium]MCA9221548.1 phosphatidate cytidylyltransferase [Planctomycetales bacterium]
MLRWRLISAAVVLTILLGFLHLDFHYSHWIGASGLWLMPILIALTVMATQEMLHLLAGRNYLPVRWAVHAGTLMVVLASAAPLAWDVMGKPYPPDCPLGKLGWPLLAFGFAVTLLFVAEMMRYREPGVATVHLAAGVFVVGYIGVPLAFLAILRQFRDHAWGMAALISLIVIVKMSDTGAYFTGRAIGRHKFVPLLSPKKTVEGIIGGLVVACLSSLAFFYWIVPRLVGDITYQPRWWGCLLYALVLAIAGIIGDLGESLMKRDLGQKDSSTWLPGLGGVLDILDALLIAAPAAFLCWAAGLV